MQTSSDSKQIGAVQFVIILLTVATALIHLYLSTQLIAAGMSGTLFILNGLGYLSLLAALFLPLPIVKNYRPAFRILLMVFTLVTIIAWIFLGARDAWGFGDKAIEVVLIVLLWFDRSRG